MNLKTVVFSASLLLGVSLGAHAQVGVYGMISTERITGVDCMAKTSQTIPTDCSSQDRIDRTTGGGGGVYYDFMKLGRTRLGVDLRGDVQKSNKSASSTLAGKNALRMDEVIGGVRASWAFHKNILKPYAEVGVGWNQRSSGQCGTPTAASASCANFLAYRVYGGLDIAALPFMDVRLPEVSIGQNVGRNGTASNWVQSGSLGIVFHFPTR
jgi:hypothetical protein